jgi:hypothetical protein
MSEINKAGVSHFEDRSSSDDDFKLEKKIDQGHSELYLQAVERYPTDDTIDQAEERRLVRKLDKRILPLLGICYFFYYV